MTPRRDEHLLSGGAIRRRLHPQRIGREIIVLDEVNSTNTYAQEVVAGKDHAEADGTVVFAEHQTAGRGRLGRRWISPRGAGLYMSVLLHESSERFCHARWMMASAVAVLEGIAASTDVEPVIRWPNDIYVGAKKLAGILIETRGIVEPGARRVSRTRSGGAPNRLAVSVGIGVNCLQQPGHFPPELRASATSLEIESSDAVDRCGVAVEILRRLDRRAAALSPDNDAELTAAWCEHSSDIGASVKLVEGRATYSGRIIDVHPSSGLLVQLDTGARRHFDPATTARA